MAKREPINKEEISSNESKIEIKESIKVEKVETPVETPKKKDGGCCI